METLTKEQAEKLAKYYQEIAETLGSVKKDKSVDLKPLRIQMGALAEIIGVNRFMEVRIDREYEFKAIYLSADFNWEIKTDSEGLLCLIPTRK